MMKVMTTVMEGKIWRRTCDQIELCSVADCYCAGDLGLEVKQSLGRGCQTGRWSELWRARLWVAGVVWKRASHLLTRAGCK